MIWFKACPRCKSGDLHLDEDNCKHCLQCGYTQRTRNGTLVALELALLFGTGDGGKEQMASEATEQATAIAV